MEKEKAKKAAAKAAIEFIQPNMTIGLGSGSTSAYFVSYLIEAVKKGLSIEAVCSSKKTQHLAQSGNIVVKDINEVDVIDITIDGADEIDAELNMIKGGGGAHVREKILALSSKKMYAIIDETKLVKKIGKAPLPIEILPFGNTKVQKIIKEEGFHFTLRKNLDNSPFISDNGNYIIDLDISTYADSLKNLDKFLQQICGVVASGFFFGIANKAIVGFADGHVKILH